MAQNQQVGRSNGGVGQRERHRSIRCQRSSIHRDLAAFLAERDSSCLAGCLRNRATFSSDVPSLISVEVGEVGINFGVGQRATFAGPGDDGTHVGSKT